MVYENNIWVQPHPAHSPDLNPIEHVWKAMKAILRRKYPDLHLLKNKLEDIELGEAALKEVGIVDRGYRPAGRFHATAYEGCAESTGVVYKILKLRIRHSRPSISPKIKRNLAASGFAQM